MEVLGPPSPLLTRGSDVSSELWLTLLPKLLNNPQPAIVLLVALLSKGSLVIVIYVEP